MGFLPRFALIVAIGSGLSSAACAPDPPRRTPVAIFQPSVDELARVYRENEIDGDQRFKGQQIKTTGFVLSVTRVGDAPSIGLSGTSYGTDERVRALFPSDATRALANVRKGDAVTLQCVGGGAVMGRPVLTSCALAP